MNGEVNYACGLCDAKCMLSDERKFCAFYESDRGTCIYMKLPDSLKEIEYSEEELDALC